MPAERLQKIIAAAGIASRRKAEELITGGLVSVNGQTVTELGSKADPESDHIRVNGKLLHGPERHVYLLMNKPKGYVTAWARGFTQWAASTMQVRGCCCSLTTASSRTV